MNRTIKVFVTGDEQLTIPNIARVIERYDGFVLVEATEESAAKIKKSYLAEDITDLYTLNVGARQINTWRPRIDEAGKRHPHEAYRNAKPLSRGPHHYLVQFVGPIKKQWLSGVRKAGGELRDPFGDFTYIVRADDAEVAKIAALPQVRWVGHLPFRDRVDAQALKYAGRKAGEVHSELPRTKTFPGVYTVEFFGPADVTDAKPAVKKIGFKILAEDPGGKLLVVGTDKTTKAQVKKQLEDLSAVHGVRSIQERSMRRASNDVAAGIMQTAAAMDPGGLGLSGKGEIVAVCDTGLDSGDPDNIHPDFAGRVTFIKSYPITSDWDQYIKNPGDNDGPADLDSGHGTHVAGSILGDGTSSAGLPGLNGPVRGLAHEAKLVFQAVEQELRWKNPNDAASNGRYVLAGIPLDLKDLFSDAYAKGARIHSNSWGGGHPGAYDEQCLQLDGFIWSKPDFCILVAAGNDGTDKDGDGVIYPMSVTAPGTAKNCITVGACENLRPDFTDTYGDGWHKDYPVPPFSTDPMADNPDQVVAFSRRGPTADNRIKPDILAPGTYILSTRSRFIAQNLFGWSRFAPSKLYMFDGGTSMATPLAAGAVALIREYLRKNQSLASPSAALLKAALIAGATRLPGTATKGAVVDGEQGFGRISVDAVVAPTAPTKMIFLDIAPGLETGETHTVNITVSTGNVPLRVVLAYSDYPGDRLINDLNLIVRGPSGETFVGNQTPGQPVALDSTNNAEAVNIPAPAPGQYSIQVVASDVPRGPQPFALVYAGDV